MLLPVRTGRIGMPAHSDHHLKKLREMVASDRTYTIREVKNQLSWTNESNVYYRVQVEVADNALKGNVDADGFDIEQGDDNTRVKLTDIVECRISEE